MADEPDTARRDVPQTPARPSAADGRTDTEPARATATQTLSLIHI